MANKSIAQWHAAEKAFYFRPGASLDEVKGEVIRTAKGPQIQVPIVRFAGNISFTAKVKILCEPSRFQDDPKNPLSVMVGGEDFMDWIAECERKVAEGVGETARLKPLEHSNVFGDRFCRGKLHSEVRYFDAADKRCEPMQSLKDAEVLIMGQLKPWLMHGEWGLSFRIFQIQQV